MGSLVYLSINKNTLTVFSNQKIEKLEKTIHTKDVKRTRILSSIRAHDSKINKGQGPFPSCLFLFVTKCKFQVSKSLLSGPQF